VSSDEGLDHEPENVVELPLTTDGDPCVHGEAVLVQPVYIFDWFGGPCIAVVMLLMPVLSPTVMAGTVVPVDVHPGGLGYPFWSSVPFMNVLLELATGL